jgi:hypothetical protein
LFWANDTLFTPISRIMEIAMRCIYFMVEFGNIVTSFYCR